MEVFETERELERDANHIETVIVRVQHGDRERFALIVDHFQQQIFRYCCRLLGNRYDAEDAVQDIFVKAYRSIHSYKPQVSFSAWLYRIAMNHCYNLLRKERLHRQWLRLFKPDLTTASVEQEIVGQLYSYPIEQALKQLTPEERNMVVLRVMEQRSFAEISEILLVSPNALHKRMKRIQRKLQTALTLKQEKEEMGCHETENVMNSKA
ncbi:RNA polymerase sigma factor [Paenibacillus timonensis]|jgi:RNA polymerase sigma factor (sigma-70 family)|uniref:RNA polymerase sigma factor n=1 Tax=Paenibacillus timonensis TaxID=225915 RepID=UPI0022E867FD|nr:RNA polymerase sigma factor [Paenibacillus timonensis]